MNKERRQSIAQVIGKLEDVLSEIEDLRGSIDDSCTDIEDVKDEEEEAYDNLPESLQDGNRGHNMQLAISVLDNASSILLETEPEIKVVEKSINNAIKKLKELIA